ncbi:sodium-dependent transporter bedraggled isoform X2 [Galleria mellonella]|uniref:Sodium-dependent transporter bedraggled isoform X2 n=1 Tax=Galleria mellonella TaxID=7137 RepID=A0ABM3MV99_GALME|nr:sodium-dependent transporter bedraggled isoform X2 [Galleria mellonella]
MDKLWKILSLKYWVIPKRAGYDLGRAIKMEEVKEGCYEQREDLPGSSADSDASSSTFDSNDSEDFEKTSDDEDLKEDLQKTIPECYKSDSNFSSHTSSDFNDDEFQATALCQFMDILNDLDEVLDKSLLACLDDGTRSLDSDEEDLICKLKEVIGERADTMDPYQGPSSIDDNTQVVVASVQPSRLVCEQVCTEEIYDRANLANLGRSKSFSDLSDSQREVLVSSLERANTTNDGIRNSMRRLDPIVLPAISNEQPCESLTLPVILFLEHHVNMRPTSAPIQLQLTAANLSSDGSSGPLIVGRRTLLMNRALSLPSPGESDVTTGEWTGRNTIRSMARSTSASSSSSESLGAEDPVNPTSGTTEERNDETEEPPFGVWPHRLSAMLACLSCTVGIFNISRFAIFSVHFGASFVIQFLILSLLVGIPLFTLYLCMGQVLASGPVDMWRISPIFQGVGIALLVVQAVIGMYSIIGLSWLFVYFRDSFITSEDKYKWALPHEYNFEDASLKNATFKIQETLPQYFHGEVLQRNLGLSNTSFGTIKFQVAFNLAVVWMIVFVSLSKGLRSYGKAVYMLIFLPICGILVLCTKLLTLIPYDSVTSIFLDTEWSEFFINSNSWAAAAQEIFLTWGLLGPCIMQLTSHKNAKKKTNAVLQKESACIIAFTFAVLLLGSFLANICVQILWNNGYVYVPGSFETLKSFQFLWPTSEPMPGNLVSTPTRYMGHYGSLVGVTVWRTGNAARSYSGWQPLQLATQIVPATLAALPANILSPVWAVIFYFILIIFGIAQQLAIWHCVITGIMAINAKALRVWETTITFLSCVFGLAVGYLLSTDAGVAVVHFVDVVWAGAWWQCVAHAALAVALFAVRGRPYSPDALAQALFLERRKLSAALAALLSFAWTVVLPVVLCAICVMDFRIGQQRQFYSWRKPAGYWPVWARQLAVCMQQGTLLIIPITAFIQTWRYMSKGPPDIFDRIQNLYRPRMGLESEQRPRSLPRAVPAAAAAASPAPPVDPPPKYTPPPSYSTATGARLLTTIRRSFRRLRRITSSNSEQPPADETSQIPITLSETVDRDRMEIESQPPNYSGVFATPSITITDETDSRTSRPRSSTSRNSLSLTRDYLRRSFVRKSDSAKSIRSSLRRSFKYGVTLTTSHEQLVREAEPISNTVAMSAMLDTEGSPHTRSLASVI